MFKQILLKIDDFREEKLEDYILNNLLIKLDNSKIDDIEEKAIETALTAGNAYLATYGIPALPDNIKKEIARYTVMAIGKANKLLQKQVTKKTKWYNKRHDKL